MFNNILSQAASLLQNAQPQQVAGATRDHVEQTDPQTLANHLQTGAQNMDGGELAQLGKSLLGALQQHGNDQSQVQQAGIDPNAAQNGDQQSVTALIQHAQQNPAALRDAAVKYVEQNPQMLAKIPGLVEGVLGKLKG